MYSGTWVSLETPWEGDCRLSFLSLYIWSDFYRKALILRLQIDKKKKKKLPFVLCLFVFSMSGNPQPIVCWIVPGTALNTTVTVISSITISSRKSMLFMSP